jgi:hypothetical protein
MLVGIPRLSTPEEDRSRLIGRYIEYGAVALVVVLIFVGNLYTYSNA